MKGVVEPRVGLEVIAALDLVEDPAERVDGRRVDAGCGERGRVRFEHTAQLGEFEHAGHGQQPDGQRQAADQVGGAQLTDVAPGAVPGLEHAECGQHPDGFAQRSA